MDVLMIIIIYFAVLNVLGFATMGIDKWRAVHHAWRIPEAILFFLCFIGGSIGSFLGMHIFRHKTRKWYFRYGFLVIMAIHLAIAAYIIGSEKFVIM